VLPLLQSQPPGAVAHVADPGSLAVRAFSVRFHRSVNPSFPGVSLFLAPGTVIGTPVPLAQAPDQCTATPALPAFTLENAKATLVTARRTIGGHEVRECCPLVSDRGPQDLPDRFHKGTDFFPAQAAAASGRVYFCTKQRFAYIDVTKSGNPALVQQKGFDVAPAVRDQRPQPFPVETTAERVLPEPAQLGNLAHPANVVSSKQPEPARIAVFEQGTIGQADNRMGMTRWFFAPALVKHAAAHSQMDQQVRTWFQLYNQVFAAAAYFRDHASAQNVRKRRSHRSPQRKPRQANLPYASADNTPAQLPRDRFDFRHLRHGLVAMADVGWSPLTNYRLPVSGGKTSIKAETENTALPNPGSP
jgi:hypothetical protein